MRLTRGVLNDCDIRRPMALPLQLFGFGYVFFRHGYEAQCNLAIGKARNVQASSRLTAVITRTWHATPKVPA